MPTATTATSIGSLDHAMNLAVTAIGDQEFVSQSCCVDVFLDLYQASNDASIRWSIGDRLREIRHLRVVRGDDMRAGLAAIADLAGDRRDTDWCDGLVAACCLTQDLRSD